MSATSNNLTNILQLPPQERHQQLVELLASLILTVIASPDSFSKFRTTSPEIVNKLVSDFSNKTEEQVKIDISEYDINTFRTILLYVAGIFSTHDELVPFILGGYKFPEADTVAVEDDSLVAVADLEESGAELSTVKDDAVNSKLSIDQSNNELIKKVESNLDELPEISAGSGVTISSISTEVAREIVDLGDDEIRDNFQTSITAAVPQIVLDIRSDYVRGGIEFDSSKTKINNVLILLKNRLKENMQSSASGTDNQLANQRNILDDLLATLTEKELLIDPLIVFKGKAVISPNDDSIMFLIPNLYDFPSFFNQPLENNAEIENLVLAKLDELYSKTVLLESLQGMDLEYDVYKIEQQIQSKSGEDLSNWILDSGILLEIAQKLDKGEFFNDYCSNLSINPVVFEEKYERSIFTLAFSFINSLIPKWKLETLNTILNRSDNNLFPEEDVNAVKESETWRIAEELNNAFYMDETGQIVKNTNFVIPEGIEQFIDTEVQDEYIRSFEDYKEGKINGRIQRELIDQTNNKKSKDERVSNISDFILQMLRVLPKLIYTDKILERCLFCSQKSSLLNLAYAKYYLIKLAFDLPGDHDNEEIKKLWKKANQHILKKLADKVVEIAKSPFQG